MITINKSKNRFVASGIWIIIIMGLCFMPNNGSISSPWAAILHVDKIGHFGIYAILGILLMRDNLSAFQGFIACLVLGLLVELIQGSFLTSRHFEFLDLIANIIGYFVGIGLFQLCKSKEYV